MKKFLIFCLLPLSLLLGGCVKKNEPVALMMVVSGNLLGELEPCGCTLEGDFGGIKRQASVIEQLRKQDPNLLLVSTGALLDTEAVSANIKNQYILTGFQQLNYDAIALQNRDQSFGLSSLRTTALPWLAKNVLADFVATERKKTIKEISVSVFSAMQAESQTESLPAALIKKIQQRHQQGVLTILITDQQPEHLKQTLDFKNLDILIMPNNDTKFSEPQIFGRTLVVRPGNQGQKLGVLHLMVKQGHIINYRQTIQALGKTIPDAPSLKTWYSQYNQALKIFYQARAKISAELMQKPAYVGAETCGTCHSKALEKWHSSLHSQALLALKRVNKQFDPECVSCHVVGYGQAGGFVDEFLTPQFANVQCESCHGSGVEHVKAPALNKMADLKRRHPPVCVACHNEKHSPVFNFDQYWPRVAH